MSKSKKAKKVFCCSLVGNGNIEITIEEGALGNNIMQGLTNIINSVAKQSEIEFTDVLKELNLYNEMLKKMV